MARTARMGITNGLLALTDSNGIKKQYEVSFTGKAAINISGGDLSQPLKFTRTMEPTSMLESLFRFDRGKLAEKASSIGIIVLIAAASRLILLALKTISTFIIFSNWSFLKYIYVDHKNRKQTIHYLVLNILKFIVYLIALGFILAELGVNYTAYLASLSVIGLAIGFGSQGLVHDLVTGIFLVFEGQCDVGDMVEVSG